MENRCPLTPAVTRASAGALELMDMFVVENLVVFLEEIKAKGWVIYSTECDPDPSKKDIRPPNISVS